MLARQNAAVVLIGSRATEFSLRGWEAYAGAKSMAANLIDRLERSYSSYGVRGLTMMPGLVATRFSEAFRGEAPALLPQEVADATIRAVLNGRRDGNVMMLEPGREVRGRLGFHNVTLAPVPSNSREALVVPKEGAHGERPESDSGVSDIVRRVLGLAPQTSLREAALGMTPGWDSLKHIELLLRIESALGIRFGSGEMEAVQNFPALEALARKKLSERPRT
jgi:acyl carrier protein